MQNIFLQHTEPHPDGISIHGRDFHYLRTVRRTGVGDRFTAVWGDQVYLLRVSSVEDGRIICSIENRRGVRDRLSPDIFVYQGLLKSAKMDLVVSRLAELGVCALTPLVTVRTVARGVPGSSRMERWRKLAAEGAKVSGVERPMHITGPVPFPELAGRLDPEGAGEATGSAVMIFCAPGVHPGAARVRALLESLDRSPPAFHLLFGPEGGFTEREVELVVEAGGRAVSMGPLIFRSETAAILGAGFVRLFCEEQP